MLELLIVVVLFGIFLGAAHESVITGLRTVNASDEREDARQQLANALEILTREASLASQVDTASDQQFQFDADLNGDGTTESDVVYQVSGGDLQRVFNGATVTLVRDLTALDFNYADLAEASLASPVSGCDLDRLRVIQVTLTATKDQEVLSLAGAAYLRNNY